MSGEQVHRRHIIRRRGDENIFSGHVDRNGDLADGYLENSLNYIIYKKHTYILPGNIITPTRNTREVK
jgi:hypothetical protein